MNWTADAVQGARNRRVRLRDGRIVRIKYFDADGWALTWSGGELIAGDIWTLAAVLNGNEAEIIP